MGLGEFDRRRSVGRTTQKMGDKDGGEKFDVFLSFGSCSSLLFAQLAFPSSSHSYAIIIPHVDGIWSGQEMNLGRRAEKMGLCLLQGDE